MSAIPIHENHLSDIDSIVKQKSMDLLKFCVENNIPMLINTVNQSHNKALFYLTTDLESQKCEAAKFNGIMHSIDAAAKHLSGGGIFLSYK